MNVSKEEAGNSLPTVFSYGENSMLRTMIIDDQPWMVAKDVCDNLGIKNYRDKVSTQLDDDEKRMSVFPTPRGKQNMWTVNESGFYNLVFHSHKPEAKAFRKWVTSVVLPQIRQTGAFTADRDSGIKNLQELADKAAGIAGSYNKLGASLGMSAAYFTFLHNDPQSLTPERARRMREGCLRIIKKGISISTPDHRTTGLLMQVEDKDLRIALWKKFKKGGLI